MSSSGNAQENERLAVRTHQLTLALMKQTSAADTVRAMAASLAEDFHGDLVRMVLLHPVDGLEDDDWLQVIAEGDARLDGFRDLLGNGEPLCGRLHPDKNALLYGARVDEVQSSALLVLPGIGLVAVGSHDGNRFFPGMGTLFLRMMGEALGGRVAAVPARREMNTATSPVDDFLAHLAVERRSSAHTLDAYRRDLLVLLHWSDGQSRDLLQLSAR